MGTPSTEVGLWPSKYTANGQETDAEQRKFGEQKGLDTPVVQTVNDAHCLAWGRESL